MRFPRVIRLDDSDRRVFPAPASPGEWAVSGAFEFLGLALESADAGTREAFHHGFLGTTSFGWSSLVEVDDIGELEYDAVIERLANHLLQQHGAPDMEAARTAAREEAAFAASLCQHPLRTVLSVEREIGEEGVAENFRVARAADPLDHSRLKIWTIEKD